MQNVALSDDLLNQLTRRERKHAKKLYENERRLIKRVEENKDQRKVFEDIRKDKLYYVRVWI